MKTMRVQLTQGFEAIVDEDIADTILKLKWHVSSPLEKRVYARSWVPLGNKKRALASMHHLVIGYPVGGRVVDHINGNGLDNRRGNLRIVTQRENTWNRHNGKKSSRFVGVSWERDAKKWQAHIMINKKLLRLGNFEIETDAANAYQEALKGI